MTALAQQQTQTEFRIKYDCCPLCKSEDFIASVRGDCSKYPHYKPALSPVMQWMDCNACGHQFLEGYFNDEGLKLLFSETFDNQKVGFQAEQQRKVSAKMVERVLDYQDNGRWLDVGFGNGSLLLTAEEFGFSPVGVDLRLENVNAMKLLGVEAHCELIEKIEFEEKFSVISMMDVLEHVPYPKDMLGAVSDNLIDGGVVLVSMPNTESILWKLFTNNNVNPYIAELEHYHNFGRTRLYQLLEEFSLKPLKFGISERYRLCMEVVAQKVS